MATLVALCLLALLALVLVLDASRFIIPNWLNGLILALFIPHLWLSPEASLTYADGGVALAVLAVGFLCFRLGWMGGGDAKLLAVLSLWTGSQNVVSFLLLTGLAGGGLALVLLGLRQSAWLWEPRLQQAFGVQQLPRLLQHDAPLPYGLAIVAGFVKTLHAGMVPGLTWPF